MAAFNAFARQTLIFDSHDLSKPLEVLPAMPDPTFDATATEWSPGGRQLAFDEMTSHTIWVYSFDTRAYRRVGDGGESSWLADGRRLLAVVRGGIWVIDSISGERKEIVTVSGETLGYPMAVAGDSEVLVRRGSFSSDIWVARFGER